LIAVGAYVQIALKDYFDLIEGSFSSAAALLIAVGVIIFFIAFFGCCGAYKENRTCVLIVSLGILLFMTDNLFGTVVEMAGEKEGS
jgi:CD63 antigen